jgi:hypothetical protein
MTAPAGPFLTWAARSAGRTLFGMLAVWVLASGLFFWHERYAACRHLQTFPNSMIIEHPADPSWLDLWFMKRSAAHMQVRDELVLRCHG